MTWIVRAKAVVQSGLRGAAEVLRRLVTLGRKAVGLALPGLGQVRIASVTENSNGERQLQVNVIAAVLMPVLIVAALAIGLAALQYAFLPQVVIAAGAVLATYAAWESGAAGSATTSANSVRIPAGSEWPETSAGRRAGRGRARSARSTEVTA